MKDDDNLLDVLCHINRKETLARHPLTREYLDAGEWILTERFFAGPPDGTQPERNFRLISRKRVIEAVPGGRGTIGTFKDRWPYFSDYLSDLILYVLRARTFCDRTNLADEAVDAFDTDKLSTVVHEITHRDLSLLKKAAAMRFLFLFTALAGRDPLINKAVSRVFGEVADKWSSVYDHFLRSQNLKLRRGITLDKFSTILSSVADGLTLRNACDDQTSVPSGDQSSVRSSDRPISLLGTAVLAFAVGCVDYSGDGRTVEETADALLTPR